MNVEKYSEILTYQYLRLSKKSAVILGMHEGAQPLYFYRIDRLFRSGGAIFRSVSAEKSFPQQVVAGQKPLTCNEKAVEKVFRQPDGELAFDTKAGSPDVFFHAFYGQ